ncbi:immunoglobulin domain-containing protein, partial [bacterium]|nr:immunoglobulin domain-containing protein [bacterium]
MSYQWFFGESLIENATSNTLTLKAIGLEQAGQYSVRIGNAPIADVSSRSAIVTVTPPEPPSILSQPISIIVDVSTNISLSVLSKGTPPLEYQWFFNGSSLAGENGPMLRIERAELKNAGTYFVLVSSFNGEVIASENAEVTVVVPQPPVIVQALKGTSAKWGENVHFAVTTVGSAPFEHAWTYNGR